MKSFKAMVSEVAQPEPEEEKAFKAQHKVVANKHPVALETQHKGTKPKAKRPADQEGDANYDLAYESVGLGEMKVKNSAAAFKLETEISNLEKRIEKLKPLALKDDDANMKLGIAKKSLKQKQDSHSALMREAVDLLENPQEEIPMMMSQLAFLCYAAEEISGMLKLGGDPEEWFQNKLAGVSNDMQSMYAYMQGKNQMGEAVYTTKKEELSAKQKKIDLNKNGKVDGNDLAALRAKKNESSCGTSGKKMKEELKGNQHKIDKNKNGKIDAQDFKLLNKEAAEKPASPFDLKNYKSQIPTKSGEKAGFDSKKVSTGTVYSRKPVKESLDEAFKTGLVKLKDGSSMVLKKEDADILNKLLGKMSGGSVSKMTETAMKDKNGFAEILAFAKEAA